MVRPNKGRIVPVLERVQPPFCRWDRSDAKLATDDHPSKWGGGDRNEILARIVGRTRPYAVRQCGGYRHTRHHLPHAGHCPNTVSQRVDSGDRLSYNADKAEAFRSETHPSHCLTVL